MFFYCIFRRKNELLKKNNYRIVKAISKLSGSYYIKIRYK